MHWQKRQDIVVTTEWTQRDLDVLYFQYQMFRIIMDINTPNSASSVFQSNRTSKSASSLLHLSKRFGHPSWIPASSPSRGGDVAVHVFGINQPNLPSPFYFVLVFKSVFMALSTAVHSISSPSNSLPFSLCSSGLISVLLVLSTIYLFAKVSLSPDIILRGWLSLKHQLTN